MTPQERLQKITAELTARGVRDVKFTWARHGTRLSVDTVTNDVCEALQAYLDGNYHPLPPANDSVR